MMAPLSRYLDVAYRQNVLGESIDSRQAIEDSPEFRAALEQERIRIRKLAGRVGNLANRCFASYQHLRAIEEALAMLKEKDNAAG